MIKSYQISDLFYGQTMANISELIHLNEPIWTNGKDYILLSCTHTPKIFPLVRSASVQVNQQGSSACSGSWMAVDSVWHEVTPKELITIPLLHVISFPIWTSFKFLWSRNPIRNYQNIEWHSSWKIQNILFFELYLWSGWICDCVFVE